MALVSKTSAKFTSITRGSTRSYIEQLYHAYVVSRRKEKFCDAELIFTGLQNTMRRCLGGILQLAGVGKELHEADTLDKAITEAISSLDDVLCYAMGGYSEVVEMHAKGLLMYQSRV